MPPIVRKKLGEMLIEAGKITRQQLEQALSEQRKSGEKLGKTLVRLHILEEKEIIETLSQQLKIPIIDLSHYRLDKELTRLIPEDIARKYQIFPLYRNLNVLTVAMVDPLDVYAIDEVIRITQHEVELAICTEADLKQAIDRYYGTSTLVEEAIKSITEEESLEPIEREAERIEIDRLRDIAEDTPVIRLVNNLLVQAVREGASDIHIEPEENSLRIRFRIDGTLHEMSSPPKQMQLPVISRVKIMSKMDIAKMRVPQDGRFDVSIEGKEVGIRVSTFPTYHGENVVMRLLDKTTSLYGLDKIGLLEEDQNRLEHVIKRPYGFVLATGPTGSGKTTTLYAVLNTINSVEKNIITIEDPIEYTMELVRQSQINPKAGLTFGTGLRAILRQDPDIIMVGEIRDKETATIAIQSALTGHLVLSTLHTNDAPSAITRLIDMGVEPFLVASSVTAVVAQRLARMICEHCKEPYTPSTEVLERMGLTDLENPVLYRGKGCPQCRNTGCKGRTGIFEILTVNDEIRALAMGKPSFDVILKAAQKAGMRTMKEDAILKALKGIIALEEALTVVQMD
ncbi:MAG: Flp pilus assembly complex ATPase component TadA [Deltaproteobacteria bacterium]|nr:Flp pilus assembly complex ATPase component TadA [Deltaproteobacteria bacterium]MBW2020395.1 Flp pilus assembly complex ATPase component TadA [Deltaproteobacteria bacterium]MBW2074675.1 Flp pilus assembly complex ATPase component TadA [Deltaproteobacteria bacterium]RLB82551.1 MAG: hypothetical protein DRH17_05285 [Deltaproteobacteria bacterium]